MFGQILLKFFVASCLFGPRAYNKEIDIVISSKKSTLGVVRDDMHVKSPINIDAKASRVIFMYFFLSTDKSCLVDI